MGKKLTEAQRRALAYIQTMTDRGAAAHADATPGNRGLFERLADASLIASKPPFAGRYHSMTITAAGRSALAEEERG